MAEWRPFTAQLIERLALIEAEGLTLLDQSKISTRQDDRYSNVVVIGPPHSFDDLGAAATRVQMDLLSEYRKWEELYVLLERRVPPGLQRVSQPTRKLITSWLERTGERWSVPATIAEAKDAFRQAIDRLRTVLTFLAGTSPPKVIAAPDTNALTDQPDVASYRSVLGCDSFEVVLLPTILGELDELKVRARPEYQPRVKDAIRRLKGWETQGDWLRGVTIDGTISLRAEAREPNFDETVSWLDPTNNDDRFLAGVLELQRSEPNSCVVVVSSDLNLRNKAAALSLPRVVPPEDR
ncbi:MAG: hypothetical protein HMLKMBBP_01363 [Planctomycetes bacterium]|nr:hypothetical protein [Planctomycetota bacterium]